jgi:DNA-binding transcriptional LysR family regulator
MNLGEFVGLPHALVSPKGDTHGAIDVALQKVARMRKVVVTCPNFLAVPFLVGSSDVIAVIAERAAIRLADAAGLSLFELPIKIPGWSVYIGRARGRAAEPEIAWLTNVIAAAARS